MAPVTSGRAAALAVAALVILVAGSACSPSPRPSPVVSAAPAPSSRPSPPSPALSVCLGEVPGQWAAAWKERPIRLPQGMTFGVNAIDGDLAFGQVDHDGKPGVGYLDLNSGRMTMISPYAKGVSGLGWLTVDRPWVVWEQLNSVSNLSDWSVHAYDLSSGKGFLLSSGNRLPGPQPMPLVRGGIAAWSQPVAGQGTEIVAVDLASRRSRTLATGRVGSPVPAGTMLVWSEMDSAGAFSFQAVDAKTLEPVRFPATASTAGGVGFTGGSADYLVWSSQDSTALSAMRLTDGSAKTYRLGDRRHHFQFLQVAGDFLVWYSGITSSVLDLSTGNGFDIAGTATGSAGSIAASIPQTSGGNVTFTVTRLPTQAAPHITRCGNRSTG